MVERVETERFTFCPTGIDGLWEVERRTTGDERGTFGRLFGRREWEAVGVVDAEITQVNLSTTSRRGTVRGLHFQRAPHADIKIVTCRRGRALDVAVDVREESPTFLQWRAVELSADTPTSLVIPRGCAHGFQALTDDVELLYLHTHDFVPESDDGVSATDGTIGVEWPLPITLMSDRDAHLPTAAERFAKGPR